MRSYLIMLFLAGWFVSGCAPDPAAALLGSWDKSVRPHTNPFVLTLTFREDGSYRASHRSGETEGLYHVHRDTITIIDDDCDDYVGVYTFTVSGPALTFRLVADGSNRPEVLPGVWYKQEN